MSVHIMQHLATKWHAFNEHSPTPKYAVNDSANCCKHAKRNAIHIVTHTLHRILMGEHFYVSFPLRWLYYLWSPKSDSFDDEANPPRLTSKQVVHSPRYTRTDRQPRRHYDEHVYISNKQLTTSKTQLFNWPVSTSSGPSRMRSCLVSLIPRDKRHKRTQTEGITAITVTSSPCVVLATVYQMLPYSFYL